MQPVKQEFQGVHRDIVLCGKLSFYEKGFIFTDNRLGAFVVPYASIERLTFHVTDDRDWMEVALTEQGMDLIPASYIAESVFYLIVPHEFSTDKIHKLEKLFAEIRGETLLNTSEAETASEKTAATEESKQLAILKAPQITRVYGELTKVINSFAMQNFAKNEKEYKAIYGSEYAHFDWDKELYSELLEFHAI